MPLVSRNGTKTACNVVFGVNGWKASGMERMEEKREVELGGT
jgi:hypothetical protein